MRPRAFLTRLLGDRYGASAAEFALVLPIALLFLLGIIDVGRFMYGVTQAEKATQAGARRAVVTDLVPSALATYSFAVSGGIAPGEPIPQSSFPGVTCSANSSGTPVCSCFSGGTCSFALTADQTAFDNLVEHMHIIYPAVQRSNVIVDYSYSGLGYAGNPNGPDVAPIVTVRLKDLPFNPLFLGTVATFAIPGTSYSLTLEDGAGNFSN